MRRYNVYFFIFVQILSLGLLNYSEAKTLSFEGQEWIVGDAEGSAARVENFKERPALFLSRNSAQLNGPDLRDMVVEYEYASTHASGFIGIDFRADEATSSLEQFYTRPHQSGQPDATQYMVMINGVATWQLHAGPNEATATELPAQEWIKIKIVAIGDKADIFVGDMDIPLLHVPDLRYDNGTGKVAFYASDRPWRKDTGAYFSNITVRPATKKDEIIGKPQEVAPLPKGLVQTFDVSAPFSEDILMDVFDITKIESLPDTWNTLGIENDGVGNLARTTPRTNEANTVLVRFKIKSKVDTHRLLKFGYSDRVRLFVNGKLVFVGNAKWRSRDHRFLGTVGLEDSIALALQKGETEIIAAVSESFGGWGFKASLENRDGIKVGN